MLSCLFVFIFWGTFVLMFNVHYLIILLSLEILLLVVYLAFCLSFLASFGLIGFFSFLVVMVCMGGFSVSLLVLLSRHYGRDFWVSRFIF